MPPALAMAVLLALPAADGPKPPAPPADAFRPDPAWKELGRSLWFDPQAKRVLLRARVVLREGYLEHLLCLEHTKEHESILATDASPRMIHAGLLLTGAEPGHPVRFQPEFKPPTGPPIDLTVEWTGPDGQAHRADARQWVEDDKSGMPLAVDWVFAGSSLFKDPETGRTIYGADSGDLITVSNFMNATLDVPFASSASDAERSYVAATARIPAVGTSVTLILKPAARPTPTRYKP